MKNVIICAVCWQPVGQSCVGRLSGKEMPVKHRAAFGPQTLVVTPARAEQLQAERKAAAGKVEEALPRRSDRNKVAVPPKVKTKGDFQRHGQGQRNRKRGTDCYSPGHQKTGELTIGQLVQLAVENPAVFKRRDQ